LSAVFIASNIKSVIVFTKLNIIRIWLGITKLTLKLTLLDSKPRKESHALIYLNMLTANINIKLIAINVYFKSIGLTDNSIKRKPKSSEKLKLTQFTYI